MPRFRKKPIEIEARQYLGGTEDCIDLIRWINDGQNANDKLAFGYNGKIVIPTLEGDHNATVGDWIIKGIAGEFYPCKPDIFEATYETLQIANVKAICSEALSLMDNGSPWRPAFFRATKELKELGVSVPARPGTTTSQ